MIGPPRLATRVARLAAARLSWGETAIGDLAEEHTTFARRRGRFLAGVWYWGQALALTARACRQMVARSRLTAATLFFLGDRPMATLIGEVRIAARALRRYPSMTAAMVLTLALGLGANAATYGMIDALVLRPFSIHEVDRLVVLSENSADDPFPQETVSPANFLDMRREAEVFDGMASFGWADTNLAGTDQPEWIQGFKVSGDFFTLVGATSALGRLLDARDDVWGRHHQVVIGNGLWRRRFAGDPQVLGRTIRLDGEPYVVVGVASAGFDFPAGSEIWTPLAFTEKAAADRTDRSLTTIARLKPGVTFDTAAAEMGLIYERLKTRHPEANRTRHMVVRTFTEGMIDVAMTQILALWQAAAALVLLIGCTNIANLLIAQGATRQRELAVRLAVGASRSRLVRQLLVESVVLALVAAPAALVVAAVAFSAIRAGMPATLVRFIPGWTEMGVDLRVVAFTVGAALVAALIFGLLPALQASRPVLARLKDGGRSMTAGVSRSRLRRGLVIAEVALTLPLLVASGLAAVGAQRIASGPQGYEPDGVLRMRMILPEATYPDDSSRRQFAERLVDEAARVPRVALAATTSVLPGGESNQRRTLVVEGRPVDPDNPLFVNFRAISPDYLRLVRIPVLRGRGLAPTDVPEGERVAVISRSMAERFWPGGDAIGRRIRLGRGDVPWTTVVGVVGDTIDNWFMYRDEPTAYAPVAQAPSTSVNLALRTDADPVRLADDARRAIAAVDPLQPAFDVMTMREALRIRTTGLRFIGALMAVFGTLALVLAAVGIYSVMAHYVAQRRNEIGIRMALGASARDVVRLTIRHAGHMAAVGIAIGTALGLLLARLMESALFGIVALEPWLFASIVSILAIVALAASLLPARQASRVDPAVALRAE